VTMERRASLLVCRLGGVVTAVGYAMILSGMFCRAHKDLLQDYGGLILLTGVGAAFHDMRARVCDYLPIMQRLRRLCNFAGVPFGLGNSIYRWLYPVTFGTLLASVTFLAAAMILRAEHHLLHLVSDAFQFLCTFGLVIFLTRYRKVESTLRRLETLAHSGKLANSPPRAAKFILLMVPRRHREHVIGDLDEEYTAILLPEYGPRKARICYWWQVAISIGPLLWAQIKRGAAIAWLWKRVR
jgi:hypothetical protein